MNIMSLRVTGYIVLGVVRVLSSLFLHFLIHLMIKLPKITIVIIKSRTATVEETTTTTFTGGI